MNLDLLQQMDNLTSRSTQKKSSCKKMHSIFYPLESLRDLRFLQIETVRKASDVNICIIQQKDSRSARCRATSLATALPASLIRTLVILKTFDSLERNASFFGLSVMTVPLRI